MKESKTKRGFELIEFIDLYGLGYSIQESSSHRPAVWVGITDAKPKVMASDANRLGIKTEETSGWVDFPIPKEVLLSTRMHLSKPMLRAFIDRLELYYKEMPDYDDEEY